jgi:hypothetical protein
MRVHVRRSGGFAGLTLEGDIDTSALAPEERARVEQALGQLQPARARPSSPDRFQYDLTITTDDGLRREVTLGESDVPDELEPLLAGAVQPSLDG